MTDDKGKRILGLKKSIWKKVLGAVGGAAAGYALFFLISCKGGGG